MFKFLFMPDGDGGAMGGEAAPAADTSNTGDAPAEDTGSDAGEGTTPQEVADVLRGAGMNVSVDEPADEDAPTNEGDTNPDEVPPAPGKEGDADTPDLPQPETPADTPTDETAPVVPDFSFEVEDKEGMTYKITPGDNIEDVLAEFEPKNNGQILNILDQLREAKDQKANYDKEQATKAEEVAQADRVNTIREGWDKEIRTLQADGRIPVTTDGKDNDRVSAVYKFMGEENEKRIADGRPTLQSFEDALDKLENKEARDAKVQAAKDAKDTSRRNGALVGGSSAPATGGPAVYRAGSARNSGEAIRAMGLL